MRLSFPATLASVAFAAPASAQFGPAQALTFQASAPTSVVAADLDGDGDLDVAVTYQNNDRVVWFENQGGGNFGIAQTAATGLDDAQTVAAADMNGDGDIDLLTASFTDNKIAYFENLGSGNFAGEDVLSNTAQLARSVVAADLDGNGMPDVAAVSVGDDSLSWFRNIGNGNFAGKVVITSALTRPHDLVTGDFDLDGDLDIAVSSNGIAFSGDQDSLDWLANDGSGNFGAPINIVDDTAIDQPRRLALGLIDGDNILDLIAVSEADDKISWYRGTGSGFGSQNVITTSVDFPSAAVPADVDGDGDTDLICTGFFGTTVFWLQNNGAGGFGGPITIDSSGSGGLHVVAIDADSDGDSDAVAIEFLTGEVNYYENLTALGAPYCDGVPNSTGQPGLLIATGSAVAGNNDVTLNGIQLPAGTFGFFVTSLTQGLLVGVGGSQGNLCLGGQIGRYNLASQVQVSDATGRMSLGIDLTMTPTPFMPVPVLAGETRNFQTWYRDVVGGMNTSNFTSAVAIPFL